MELSPSQGGNGITLKKEWSSADKALTVPAGAVFVSIDGQAVGELGFKEACDVLRQSQQRLVVYALPADTDAGTAAAAAVTATT